MELIAETLHSVLLLTLTVYCIKTPVHNHNLIDPLDLNFKDSKSSSLKIKNQGVARRWSSG